MKSHEAWVTQAASPRLPGPSGKGLLTTAAIAFVGVQDSPVTTSWDHRDFRRPDAQPRRALRAGQATPRPIQKGFVVTFLEDIYTPFEKTLIAGDHSQHVIEGRFAFQQRWGTPTSGSSKPLLAAKSELSSPKPHRPRHSSRNLRPRTPRRRRGIRLRRDNLGLRERPESARRPFCAIGRDPSITSLTASSLNSGVNRTRSPDMISSSLQMDCGDHYPKNSKLTPLLAEPQPRDPDPLVEERRQSPRPPPTRQRPHRLQESHLATAPQDRPLVTVRPASRRRCHASYPGLR